MKSKLLRKIRSDYTIIKYPYAKATLKKHLYNCSPSWYDYDYYNYLVYYGFLQLFKKEFKNKIEVNNFILERYKKKYYRYSKKYWL